MSERVGFDHGTASRIAIYVALALGAAVAPVVLSALEPRFLAGCIQARLVNGASLRIELTNFDPDEMPDASIPNTSDTIVASSDIGLHPTVESTKYVIEAVQLVAEGKVHPHRVRVV